MNRSIARWAVTAIASAATVAGGLAATPADAATSATAVTTVATTTTATVTAAAKAAGQATTATALATTNTATTAMVPVSGTSLKVTVPSATPAGATSSATILNGAGTSKVAVQQLDDSSTRVSYVMNSAKDPSSFTVNTSGASKLVANSDGTITAYDASGMPVGGADAPWARDAKGKAVPTKYVVNGISLTQVIDTSAGGYAYPITADPTLHWWGVTFVVSHSTAQKIVWLMGSATTTSGFVASVCGGSILLAIPCKIGYAAIALMMGIGAATVNYCDRYSRGIKLNYHYGISWLNIPAYWTCGTR